MRILRIIGILAFICIVGCYVKFLINWAEEDVAIQNHQKMVDRVHHSNQLIQKKIWGDIYPKEKHKPVR